MLSLFFVDDHPAVIRSMARVMEEDLGVKVIGIAFDGHEFLKAIRTAEPDVIVLDYFLPDMNGDKVLEELAKFCTVPVLILTGQPTLELCRQVLSRGARGFISKTAELEEICFAAQTLNHGGCYIPPEYAAMFTETPEEKLTEREHQIQELMLNGMNYQKIAAKLSISVKTVYAHKEHIFKKNRVSNIVELVKKLRSF
ncbi:MAG: response regulator transcription factor [Candidatus Wallbacteria bacterium]|nr:response regulator transcription factor [Candidatus Wallbacteria bacterium]